MDWNLCGKLMTYVANIGPMPLGAAVDFFEGAWVHPPWPVWHTDSSQDLRPTRQKTFSPRSERVVVKLARIWPSTTGSDWICAPLQSIDIVPAHLYLLQWKIKENKAGTGWILKLNTWEYLKWTVRNRQSQNNHVCGYWYLHSYPSLTAAPLLGFDREL